MSDTDDTLRLHHRRRALREVAGDSGNVKVHAFCPDCGTPVYLCFAAMPEMIAVPAGSLDDPDRFTPEVLTYSVRGLAWDTIDPSLHAFERMPPV